MKNTHSNSKTGVFPFSEAHIVKVEGLPELLARFSKHVEVSYSGFSTVKTYRRTLRDISLFHGCLPENH